MTYITVRQSPRFHQITFDEILSGKIDASLFEPKGVGGGSATRTYYSPVNNGYRLLGNCEFERSNKLYSMKQRLKEFNDSHEKLFSMNRGELYETFHIPKRSGGLRRIDAPKPELMDALHELKGIFENDFNALYHTSAFAYIKNRSTINVAQRHQSNESRWFGKFDFSNFFGSTTENFLYGMLSTIFPFNLLVGKDLEKALSLCFLNGGLPQGTPISPLLTNVMMIPIDHAISRGLANFDHFKADKSKRQKDHFVYTRYADDITISCKYDFNISEMEEYINSVLSKFNAPFQIKKEKTKYVSSSGSNWILGVMLNKDNQITIGRKNKKRVEAMLNNYVLDRNNGKGWPINDIQILNGHISYYKMVEPNFISGLFKKIDNKYGSSAEQLIRNDLKQNA